MSDGRDARDPGSDVDESRWDDLRQQADSLDQQVRDEEQQVDRSQRSLDESYEEEFGNARDVGEHDEIAARKSADERRIRERLNDLRRRAADARRAADEARERELAARAARGRPTTGTPGRPGTEHQVIQREAGLDTGTVPGGVTRHDADMVAGQQRSIEDSERFYREEIEAREREERYRAAAERPSVLDEVDESARPTPARLRTWIIGFAGIGVFVITALILWQALQRTASPAAPVPSAAPAAETAAPGTHAPAALTPAPSGRGLVCGGLLGPTCPPRP